jgi:superfamily I DNA/RNA helicase
MTATKQFPPTSEQQAALDAFATGEDVVIEAAAGTGKTTTLRLLAESTDESGIYVVYNKAAQTDAAASFPSNVQVRTAHSLAFGTVKNSKKGGLMSRLNGNRLPSKACVDILGIPAGFQADEEHFIPDWIVSRSALDAVGRFCNSADDEITEYHVPKIDGLEDQRSYKQYVVPFAKKAWEDLNDLAGKLQFKHDHYLKIWALSRPTLRCDFVMLDEAQDANPVIARVVEEQEMQKVMVGDRCQAIYGWRGAVDAMTKFQTEHRLFLSQSFRFGPAVAEQANRFLELLDAPLRLSGFESIVSTVGVVADPDAILCRTNASVIEHAMAAQAGGKRVAIVGGTREIEEFAKAARDLMQGRNVSHRDLVAFKSWNEVIAYSKTEEGRDLRVMVSLIQNYSVEEILSVCQASVNESEADLIATTAHKAKGREWDHVRISNDFTAPEEGEEPSRPELMLAYVAVTRAKLTLDLGTLSWINDYSPVAA